MKILQLIDLSYDNGILTISIIVILSILTFFAISFPFINLLYKLRFYKTKKTGNVDTTNRNPLWYKHFGNNLDTPSSYGFMLIMILVLLLIISVVQPFENTIRQTILFFFLFWVLGLLDDVHKYFLYLKTSKWGIGSKTQLFAQIFLVVLFLSVYHVSFSPLLLIVFTLFIVFTLNSYNITDGIDGLVASLTIPILPLLMHFEYSIYGWTNYHMIYGLLLGFFIVFAYFNIKPARVMLGDVGSTPLGFLFGLLLLRYPIFPLLILYTVFLTEGLSSLIQIASIKLLKKKVFKIAPLHIHLLNTGWSDTKIVQRAWIIQIILVSASLCAFSLGL